MSTSSDEPDLDYGPTLRGLREGMKVFQRYQLLRQLGRGGMGVVWLAQDEKLMELDIALKFLPENLVHDEVALDDLRQETRRCMRLTHQNIVHVYDLVDDRCQHRGHRHGVSSKARRFPALRHGEAKSGIC